MSEIERIERLLAEPELYSLRCPAQPDFRFAAHLPKALRQFIHQRLEVRHLFGCSDEQVHHSAGVCDTNVLGCDLMIRRAIVIVAERDTNGSRLIAELLKRSCFAGSASH